MATFRARLCLLFTPSVCRSDPWDTLAAALAGGVDLVQWRVKDDRTVGLERCLALCRAHAVEVIVNDDPALAVTAGAAGAHVGQDDLSAAAAREVLGPTRLLGVSTHDAAQLAAAHAAGADYAGFGPCFATATKGYREGLGPEALRVALAGARLPVFAIGGITTDNLPALIAAGCTRVAVSSAILGAADPTDAARALRRLLPA